LLRFAVLVAGATALALAALGFVRFRFHAGAIHEGGDSAPQQEPVRFGVSISEPGAFPGYTLLAPLQSRQTYLIDMQGRVVRTWQSDSPPALVAQLLDNGHLLRTGALRRLPGMGASCAGGRVQEFTWEGKLVWDLQITQEAQLSHHDLARLPNGNVLLIVSESKTEAEARAAGRRPDRVDEQGLLLDCLIEVQPTGATTGTVVWEWHLWDHLIQDCDKARGNYGPVAAHPERVDFNYVENVVAGIAATPGALNKLRSIGYVGSTTPRKRLDPNWSHFNALAYNSDLDQIAVTSLTFCEVWIIDHSTTSAEAANHSGGRSGQGGDLLYRWGNPRAYRAGTTADQRLFAAHNAHWIPRGLPGAGHLLVFNNGPGRPDGLYSSVDELLLPVDEKGRYARPSGGVYGPDQPIWTYVAPKRSDLYAMILSGAQRLPNGNTLICSGSTGLLLEVTAEKEVVWKYITPPPGGLAGGAALFRAYRYGPDHAGFVGKDLTPGPTMEAVLSNAFHP
jgi:hypothetical protein